MYLGIYVFIYVCMHTSLYVFMYECTYECIYGCMYPLSLNEITSMQTTGSKQLYLHQVNYIYTKRVMVGRLGEF